MKYMLNIHIIKNTVNKINKLILSNNNNNVVYKLLNIDNIKNILIITEL